MSQLFRRHAPASAFATPECRALSLVAWLVFTVCVGRAQPVHAEWLPGNPAVPGTYAGSVTLDLNADGMPDVRFDPPGGGGSTTFLVTPLFPSLSNYTLVFATGGVAMRFQARDDILQASELSLPEEPVSLPVSFHETLGYLGVLLNFQTTLPGFPAWSSRAYFLLKTTSDSLVIVDSGFEPPPPGGVGDLGDAASFWLAPAAPNPLLVSTRIAFSLSRSGDAVLELFDATGRRVKLLFDGPLPSGEHAVLWDGRDDRGRRSAAGTYFYRLSAEGLLRTGRLVVAH